MPNAFIKTKNKDFLERAYAPTCENSETSHKKTAAYNCAKLWFNLIKDKRIKGRPRKFASRLSDPLGPMLKSFSPVLFENMALDLLCFMTIW